MYKSVCVYVCMYVCIFIYMYVCVYMGVCVYVDISIHTYLQAVVLTLDLFTVKLLRCYSLKGGSWRLC